MWFHRVVSQRNAINIPLIIWRRLTCRVVSWKFVPIAPFSAVNKTADRQNKQVISLFNWNSKQGLQTWFNSKYVICNCMNIVYISLTVCWEESRNVLRVLSLQLVQRVQIKVLKWNCQQATSTVHLFSQIFNYLEDLEQVI